MRMSNRSKIVMYEDVILEKGVVEGYTVNGCYYGDNEHQARLAGCTHTTCDKCKAIIKKYSYCAECHNKEMDQRYKNMPSKPIPEGTGVLYSMKFCEYMYSLEEAEDFADMEGCSLENLMLVHCQQEDPPYIDLENIYESITPEDFTIDDMVNEKIVELVDKLNYEIKSHGVNCYTPGGYKVDI